MPDLAQLAETSRRTFHDRRCRARANLLVAVQGGLAAGLAWWFAADVLHHYRPFFAPISSLIVIGTLVGQRVRRALELVLGVAVGIALGDVLILFIGVGPIQIAVVVILAIIAVVFLGGGALMISQAASSAVLVATLAPPSTGIYFSRFFDALIGGLAGLAVVTILLPLNPLRAVARAADPALRTLSGALMRVHEALGQRQSAWALDALDDLRAGEATQAQFRDILPVGRETVTLAPVRWRSRGELSQYVDAAVHIDRVWRNARVMARRVAYLIEDGEYAPPELVGAVRELAEGVTALRRDLAAGVEPLETRERALTAVRHAGEAYVQVLDLSGNAVVATVRNASTDLLQAAGVGYKEADGLIRRAAPVTRLPRRPVPS
ncbi:aromatic acid exporter family protein [Luedemannella flava]|uniref:Aromatic acid exporter family protein n=1 Tax=Luedemannella flava TaxID=349316 RepID=A0ABN2M8I5_9ACTN